MDKLNAVLAIRKAQDGGDAQASTDNSNNVIWHDGNPTNITEEQIADKAAELQADYDAKQYARDREKEYPTWQDQMDMLWHSIDQDAALKSKYFAFHQAILAVKSKHPK